MSLYRPRSAALENHHHKASFEDWDLDRLFIVEGGLCKSSFAIGGRHCICASVHLEIAMCVRGGASSLVFEG